MADDNNPINKSNKPVNGSLGKIERIQARRESEVSTYTDDLDKLREAITKEESKFKNLEAQYRQTNDSKIRAELNVRIANQAERYTQAEERKIKYEESYARKVNAQAAQEISTYTKYDNVNSRTTTMSSSQRYFSQIQQNARAGGELLQVPTEVIENRIRTKQQSISNLGQILSVQTRELGYGSWSDDMKKRNFRIQQLQEDVALDKRLLKVQNKKGMTTEKRQYAAEDVSARTAMLLDQKNLEKDVSSGKYGSLEKEIKNLSEVFNQLTEASKRFEEVSNNAVDAQGNLTEEYKQASSELDRLQKETEQQRKAVIEIGRQEGRGGIGGFMQRHAPWMEAARAISGGAKATYTIAGNQDIQQMNNRAAFARAGNELYFKTNDAIYNNNIDAALELASSPALEKAYADRNRKLKHGTGALSSILDIGLSTLGSAASGAALGGAGGALFGGVGAVPGAIIGGVSGAVSGLSSSLPAMTNLFYGNEGATASFQSRDAMKGLTAEERRIRSHQMQSYYNQGLSLYGNTQGLGQAGIGLQEQLLNNKGTLSKLAGVGVSPGEAAQMAVQMRAAGSFSANEGINVLHGAGLAAQRGQLSKSEFTSMSTELMGAGGSSSNLEDIIAAATAKGMDNSKNIGQMVSSTLQLSSSMATLGVAGTSAVSNMLSSATQGLVDKGVNKNLAVGMATAGLGNYDRAISDTGFNLGNIVERQQLRSNPNFNGASIFQLNQLSNMKSGEHEILRRAIGGTDRQKQEAKNLLRAKGLDDEMFYDKEGNLKAGAVNSLGRSALTGALLNVGSAGENKDILKRLEGGQNLSAKQRAILRQAGFGEDEAKVALGIGSINRKDRDITNRMGIGRDILASKREVSETLKGKEAAEKIGPGKAFENIETLMSNLNEAVSPDKFAEISKEAAKEFRIPVVEFGGHVGKFGKVITTLVKQQSMLLKAMGEKRGSDWVPNKKKK